MEVVQHEWHEAGCTREWLARILDATFVEISHGRLSKRFAMTLRWVEAATVGQAVTNDAEGVRIASAAPVEALRIDEPTVLGHKTCSPDEIAVSKDGLPDVRPWLHQIVELEAVQKDAGHEGFAAPTAGPMAAFVGVDPVTPAARVG